MYTLILGYKAAAFYGKPKTAELLLRLSQQIEDNRDTIDITESRRAPWIYIVTLCTNENNFSQDILDLVKEMHRNGFDFHEIDEETAEALRAEIALNAKNNEERDRRYQEHAKHENVNGYYRPGMGRAKPPKPLSEQRTPC